MKKTFVISDIHGCLKALLALLEEVKFDYENDRLICLGDTCDRGYDVKGCFDELFKIKNLIYILGNHDDWVLSDFKGEFGIGDKENWWHQGGFETMKSFNSQKLPVEYGKFLNKALPYYVEDNKLFVHGGFDPETPIEKHSTTHLIWDRDLIWKAKHCQAMFKRHGHSNKVSIYDEIFIGHTPTLSIDRTTDPIHWANVWDIDTGCVYGGKLTIMNLDTKEYFQVDKNGNKK